eukprot:snap_masked-scaffold_44-processed-gene-0.20-mRNA-1 protein AED:1.00 eAED:1.00 QI:0/0/0/0/1/1/2/0/229
MKEKEENIEYEKVEYWNKRYARDQDRFEWFLKNIYPVLEGYLKNLRGKDIILVDCGCGTSTLLFELCEKKVFDEEKTKFIGLDVSEIALNSMKNRNKHENVFFQLCDLSKKFSFERESLDVVFDKSTMDCLLHGKVEVVENYLYEVSRCLKPFGYFILITQMDFQKEEDQDFFLNTVLCSLAGSEDNISYEINIHTTENCPFTIYVLRKKKFARKTRSFDALDITIHEH